MANGPQSPPHMQNLSPLNRTLLAKELQRRFGGDLTTPDAAQTVASILNSEQGLQQFLTEAQEGTIGGPGLDLGHGGIQSGLLGATLGPPLLKLAGVTAAMNPIGLGVMGAGALGLGAYGLANLFQAKERQEHGLPNTGALVGGEGFGQSGWGATDVALAPFGWGAKSLLTGGKAAKAAASGATKPLLGVSEVMTPGVQRRGRVQYSVPAGPPELHSAQQKLAGDTAENFGVHLRGRGQTSLADRFLPGGQSTPSTTSDSLVGVPDAVRRPDPPGLGGRNITRSQDLLDARGRALNEPPAVRSLHDLAALGEASQRDPTRRLAFSSNPRDWMQRPLTGTGPVNRPQGQGGFPWGKERRWDAQTPWRLDFAPPGVKPDVPTQAGAVEETAEQVTKDRPWIEFADEAPVQQTPVQQIRERIVPNLKTLATQGNLNEELLQLASSGERSELELIQEIQKVIDGQNLPQDLPTAVKDLVEDALKVSVDDIRNFRATIAGKLEANGLNWNTFTTKSHKDLTAMVKNKKALKVILELKNSLVEEQAKLTKQIQEFAQALDASAAQHSLGPVVDAGKKKVTLGNTEYTMSAIRELHDEVLNPAEEAVRSFLTS